jgi:hypothetical protein
MPADPAQSQSSLEDQLATRAPQPPPPSGPSAKGPMLADLLGGAGDVISTQIGLARGGREMNPMLPQNRLGNGLMLGGSYLANALLTKYLNDHGHPNIAKALGYAGGANGAAFTLNNLAAIRRLGGK